MSDYATVITLSAGGQTEVVPFEQAFGEYSNLFNGKGRARRANKKATKQANRQTKRMTRIDNKIERKTAKKVGRQTAKTAGKSAKLDRRQMIAEARMTRKATRHPGEDVEPEEDELETTRNADDLDRGKEPYGKKGRGDSAEESADQTQSEQEEGGGEAEEEGSFENEASDEEDAEFTGSRRQPIHPAVKKAAQIVIWNDVMAHKLDKQLKSSADGSDNADLEARIENHRTRRDQYLNMLGEYSEARGGKGGSGHREVKAAMRQATVAAKTREPLAKAAAPAANPRAATQRMPFRKPVRPTPVAASLDPQIDKDQIDIPADEVSEEFTGGTGSGITSDNLNLQQVEVPTRTVELSSNFSGSDINWKGVGIGVGIAAIAIYFLRK